MGIAERVTELLYLVEDLATEVRSYRDSIDADPARLAVVEERLAEIRQLQRKYGASIAEILDHVRGAEEELERLTGSEVDTETLAAREDALSREVGELASELSDKRSAVAESLAADVERSIARLNMGNGRICRCARSSRGRRWSSGSWPRRSRDSDSWSTRPEWIA